MAKKSQVRVRSAPSPTGYLHIGNLRTMLYNYLFARHEGGTYFLRVEDTDQSRAVPGAVEALVRTLVTVGVLHDEGPFLENGELVERGDHAPYTQSKRLDIYREHVERLVSEGKAYLCFCTSEELTAMREAAQAVGKPPAYDRRCRRLDDDERKIKLDRGMPHVIRLAAPEEGSVAFHDVIRGEISFDASEIDDAVLLKSDGYPTYHLANVVDDHLMETTHVLRGEEWISSTPKHVLIYQAFGWKSPLFAHLPLLLNSDRSKLSKRQGDVAVEDYLARGYLPEAIVNFVALLGWNPSGDREVYTMDELIESFDLGKVHAAPAVVNFEKLDWLNGHYLRALSPDAFLDCALPFLEKAGLVQKGKVDREALLRVVELERSRVKNLSELPEALAFAFGKPEIDPKVLPWKGGDKGVTRERLEALREFLGDRDVADAPALEADAKAWIKEKGWGNGEVLWPFRVALSGREHSPGPFEIAAALGKKEVVDRLDHAIKILH